MSRRRPQARALAALALAALAAAGPARAQAPAAPAPGTPPPADAPLAPPPGDPRPPDIAQLRAAFEYGRFAEVVERARERIERGRLSEGHLKELHELAGLSAFNLGRREDAQRHFRALLRIDPDHALDPFVVPPPAVEAFEAQRSELRPELDVVRQERRLRLERERAEAEARDRERRALDEQRRRLETLAARITVRTVERRSFLLNFVPFGAGQFHQGRRGPGTLLAFSQGAFIFTSIAAFLAYDDLFTTELVEIDGRLGVDGTITVPLRFIPTEDKERARVLRLVKYGSAGAFVLSWAAGTVDAVLHHQDEVVRTSYESPTLGAPAPAAEPSARLRILPSRDGLAASLTVRF